MKLLKKTTKSFEHPKLLKVIESICNDSLNEEELRKNFWL